MPCNHERILMAHCGQGQISSVSCSVAFSSVSCLGKGFWREAETGRQAERERERGEGGGGGERERERERGGEREREMEGGGREIREERRAQGKHGMVGFEEDLAVAMVICHLISDTVLEPGWVAPLLWQIWWHTIDVAIEGIGPVVDVGHKQQRLHPPGRLVDHHLPCLLFHESTIIIVSSNTSIAIVVTDLCLHLVIISTTTTIIMISCNITIKIIITIIMIVAIATTRTSPITITNMTMVKIVSIATSMINTIIIITTTDDFFVGNTIIITTMAIGIAITYHQLPSHCFGHCYCCSIIPAKNIRRRMGRACGPNAGEGAGSIPPIDNLPG